MPSVSWDVHAAILGPCFMLDFFLKKGKGTGSIKRRIPHGETVKGSTKWRQVTDIGKPGRIRVRRQSCHECDECMQLNPKNCQNVEYCGRAWEEIVSVQAERRYDNVLVDAHIRDS